MPAKSDARRAAASGIIALVDAEALARVANDDSIGLARGESALDHLAKSDADGDGSGKEPCPISD